MFLSFPLYGGGIGRWWVGVGGFGVDLVERGVPLILWLLFVAGLCVVSALGDPLDAPFVLRWGAASLAVLLVLAIDLSGSTPVLKGSLQRDRLLRIELDSRRCHGDGACEDVCPRAVLEVDPSEGAAEVASPLRCVQCGACIVQCPFDALFFRHPSGQVIPPDTVRAYKLNLLGSRLVPSRQRD